MSPFDAAFLKLFLCLVVFIFCYPGLCLSAGCFLLSTILTSGYIFTGWPLLGHNVWWLLMFCPADFCGEMNISWSYFQGYCWLFLPLYIGLWIRIYDQILSNHNMWIKLTEISPWTNICGYEWYIIQVFFKSKSGEVPGCDGRNRVAPIFGEQPDPGAPRRCYSWLTRSMRSTDITETSTSFMLLPLWVFATKFLLGKDGLKGPVSWMQTNSDLSWHKHKLCPSDLPNQYRQLIVVSIHWYINTFCSLCSVSYTHLTLPTNREV